jgi:hypothetical protein
VKASFSKTTGNKTLEFGGVSPSNGLTRYKMESFHFYLISTKCIDLGFVRPTIIRTQFCEGDESREKMADPRPSEIERA